MFVRIFAVEGIHVVMMVGRCRGAGGGGLWLGFCFVFAGVNIC